MKPRALAWQGEGALDQGGRGVEWRVEQEPEPPWDSGLKGLTALSSLPRNEAGSTQGKDFVPYPNVTGHSALRVGHRLLEGPCEWEGVSEEILMKDE